MYSPSFIFIFYLLFYLILYIYFNFIFYLWFYSILCIYFLFIEKIQWRCVQIHFLFNYILYFIYGKYWSNLFFIFDDVILVYFSCVLIHTCTWAFILGTSFWWLFMSKGNYGYYQKVHKILFMPSSIMFMLKCNSIYYHREHKKRLLPISNYDFTLMLISD